jgi:hypothetical protein
MILRQWPKAEFEQLNVLGNAYATTIHSLVSGITKLSKVTKLDTNLKLYRGFGGVKLPDSFFKPPPGGLYKGIVEWGFMSTTTEKAVAIQYSGIGMGKKFPTVLVISPAAVDHGADIKEFSQYPSEREYLWNPCSLIEAWGNPYVEATARGMFTIVPVRMNNNVKTLTLEELLNQKKKMHLSSFGIVINEIKRDLESLAEENLNAKKEKKKGTSKEQMKLVQFFVEGIVFECKNKFKRHQDKTAQDYQDDFQYQALVMEMLETKSSALSKKELCQHALKQLRTGRNAIMMVSAQGDSSRLKELLSANPKTIDETAEETGKTALHVASKRGHVDVVRTLIEKHANVNLKDSSGKTPMHMLTVAEEKEVDIIRALLDAGAEIDVPDKEGKTVLDYFEWPDKAINSVENTEDIDAGNDDEISEPTASIIIKSKQVLEKSDAMNRIMDCRNELIWRGAGEWTPLMVAAELGASEIMTVLQIQTAIKAMRDRKPFQAAFNDEVNDFADRQQWKKKHWVWEIHHQAIQIDSNGLSATKLKDKPNSDFACVLGSDELQGAGIHIWEVKVLEVQSMWLGVARGVERCNGLDSMPGMDGQADYMLAVNNLGFIDSIGQLPKIEYSEQLGEGNFQFYSGQTIQFRLDMLNCQLTMKIDGKTAFCATEIEVHGLLPYVCMDYFESAILLSTAFVPAATNTADNDTANLGDSSQTLSLDLDSDSSQESDLRIRNELYGKFGPKLIN